MGSKSQKTGKLWIAVRILAVVAAVLSIVIIQLEMSMHHAITAFLFACLLSGIAIWEIMRSWYIVTQRIRDKVIANRKNSVEKQAVQAEEARVFNELLTGIHTEEIKTLLQKLRDEDETDMVMLAKQKVDLQRRIVSLDIKNYELKTVRIALDNALKLGKLSAVVNAKTYVFTLERYQSLRRHLETGAVVLKSLKRGLERVNARIKILHLAQEVRDHKRRRDKVGQSLKDMMHSMQKGNSSNYSPRALSDLQSAFDSEKIIVEHLEDEWVEAKAALESFDQVKKKKASSQDEKSGEKKKASSEDEKSG